MSEITKAAVDAAAENLAGTIVRTPFNHSRTLSEIMGCEIFVKFENQQFTASFKDRGSLNKLLNLTVEQRQRGVIAMSAGNHAQGVAYHAQRLQIPTTIVMPEGTPNVKVEQTKGFGASVEVIGQTVDDSALYARKIMRDRNLTFVHPFDDPDVIAGQGTIALEILKDGPELDALVVPIGGGGLIAGIATVMASESPKTAIYGVEADMFPGVKNALSGLDPVSGGQTIADGIAVKKPGTLTLPIIERYCREVLLVPENDIEHAINLYISIEKTVAEGAGAISLAAVAINRELFAGQKVGLILSGGNIDTRILASILMRGLIRDGRIARLRIEISDRPSTLAEVARIIGDNGGNILEVQHQRMLIDVPAKVAELEIVMECRDSTHVKKIIDELREADYAVMRFAH